MTFARTILLSASLVLLLPSVSFADPPSHAPAHGRRAKEAHHPKPSQPAGGVQIEYDSGKGLHVAIGLPGVYFHAGSYYRHTERGWQISATGKDGWKIAAGTTVPDVVRKTHPAPPAAKAGKKHKSKGKHGR